MKFSNLHPKRITTYLFVLSLIFACSGIDDELEPIIAGISPVEPSIVPTESASEARVYYNLNGVTIKASENSQPGDTATLDGVTYLIVDDQMLRELVEGYPSNGVDLSKLVTSKVTNMSWLFFKADYNSDISNWDVSSVTDMSHMFKYAHEFNSDISNWDVSSVTNMALMFSSAKSFNQDLSNWNVENVKYHDWFESFTGSWTLPKPNFTELSPATYVYLDENGVTIKASENAQPGDKVTFEGKSYLIVDNETLRYLVRNCHPGNGIDLSRLVTSKVTDMKKLFEGISYSEADIDLDISNWDVSNVEDMSGMFSYTWRLNTDISNWNVSNVTNMKEMFYYAEKFNSNLENWNTSSVIDMSFMFSNAYEFNGDISNWNVSNVTNMEEMFRKASSFNQNLNEWNTSSTNNMYMMFADASEFNGNISNWNVSAATNMGGMFIRAYSFNQDISNWDVSSLIFMAGMFSNAIEFNQDLSNWNVENVKYHDWFDSNTISWTLPKPNFQE